MRFYDIPQNMNFCRQQTLRLNDPFNTYVGNEICQVYAFPISKSFRQMEKIDRNVQHGDYLTLLSYSPRKQAAASVRYIVYQFAIQSSRSLECSLKLFHPNLVFASFAQFRMEVYTYISIYMSACTCTCVCMCIYIYIRFQFLFSGRVRLFTSQGNVVAAQPRFVVSVVSR